MRFLLGRRRSYTYKFDSFQFEKRPIFPRPILKIGFFESSEERLVSQWILSLVLTHMEWLQVGRIWPLFHA